MSGSKDSFSSSRLLSTDTKNRGPPPQPPPVSHKPQITSVSLLNFLKIFFYKMLKFNFLLLQLFFKSLLEYQIKSSSYIYI